MLTEAAATTSTSAATTAALLCGDAGNNFLLQRFNEAADPVWLQSGTASAHAGAWTEDGGSCSQDARSNCHAAPPQTDVKGSVGLHLSPSWQQLAQLQRRQPNATGVAELAGSCTGSAASLMSSPAALAADTWQHIVSGVHACDCGNVQITGLELSFSTVSTSNSPGSVLDTAAVAGGSSTPSAAAQSEAMQRYQPTAFQAVAVMSAQAASSPASCSAPTAWQVDQVPGVLQGVVAGHAAEDDDEVCFSSPAPNLPPRLATQSVTPKQSGRTRSRTTVLAALPADSILAATSPGSVRPFCAGGAGETSGAGGHGGRSSWHAGMELVASPFAASGLDKPPAGMRYSVRHNVADADSMLPLPATTSSMRAISRSCSDVLFVRSISGGGTAVSTNCLFEPAPASLLEQLSSVPQHNETHTGDVGLPFQQTIDNPVPMYDGYGVQGGAAATAAATTPDVSSRGELPDAADVAGIAAGSGQQLASLLGGALDSLTALQGALQEGQSAADALLGRPPLAEMWLHSLDLLSNAGGGVHAPSAVGGGSRL